MHIAKRGSYAIANFMFHFIRLHDGNRQDYYWCLRRKRCSAFYFCAIKIQFELIPNNFNFNQMGRKKPSK